MPPSPMLDLLKFAFLAVTAPIWLPFLKAMWRELQDLFEEDGGLFGQDPGPVGRAAIRARRAARPSALVHEWLAHVRPTRGNVTTVGGAGSSSPTTPAAARPDPRASRGPARRSFR